MLKPLAAVHEFLQLESASGLLLAGAAASVAFEGAAEAYTVQTRLGILAGSLASAVPGYAILRNTLGKPG